jgi:uncharacterized glyoxalase superfamily protein PhnB
MAQNPPEGTPQVMPYLYYEDARAALELLMSEHHARAQAAGATILREPEDQSYGDRNYAAKDPEGHEWFFATHVRDVTSAEMAQAIGSSAA